MPMDKVSIQWKWVHVTYGDLQEGRVVHNMPRARVITNFSPVVCYCTAISKYCTAVRMDALWLELLVRQRRRAASCQHIQAQFISNHLPVEIKHG